MCLREQQIIDFRAGDKTGYGWHGDYLFGWKGNALQVALDERCQGDGCAGMKTQTADQANKCMISSQTGEQVEGWLTELPGGMPVT